MCNLAGYTGSRRAAPILIEMLKREQYYDGGLSTGIATLDNGKIYTTKLVGNVDDLLHSTDAWDFPGTIGIAHSRPGKNGVNQAHPFTDNSGHLALCLNGTLRDVDTDAFYSLSQSIMQDFLDRGFTIKSAIAKNGRHKPLSNGMTYHDTEPYALMVGDWCDNGMDLFTALGKAIGTLPGDNVTLAIHDSLPDTIAIGRITRPMEVGIGEDECYIATTSMAFPEDHRFRSIQSAPEAAVTAVRPGSFEITAAPVENCRIQQIDPCIYARAYARVETMLKTADKPLTIYDFPFFDKWQDLWQKPYVDCQYRQPHGLLKPYGALEYQILSAMRKAGLISEIRCETNTKGLIGFVWNQK